MKSDKPVILVAFKEGGENGGPFVSHKRIIDGYTSDKYELKPFVFPRSRVILSPSGVKRLVKAIKAENAVAMLVVGLQLEGFVATIICLLANIRIILAIHGSETEACDLIWPKRVIVNIIEGFTVQKADIVYGVSDYVSNWKVCKKAKKMFGTIYNLPKNHNQEEHNTKTVRKELGINDNDVVVVSTGRITVDKGYDILLQIMECFKGRENVKFVIAGNGPYKPVIERRIQQLNMDKQVFMLGYRADIDNILSGSDLFIICTKHETLCISLQEAGMHGLPLIATNVGGIPEVIDSSCGFLVENEDVEGFVQAINVFIDNPELRKKMGVNARKKIIEKFDSQKIFEKLDEVFTDIIDIGCGDK